MLIPWLPALFLLGLLSRGLASDPQDSAELLAVGRCLLGTGSCEGWDPTSRPPLTPLLGAMLQPLVPGSAALIVIAAGSMALWAGVAASLSRVWGGSGLMVVPMMWASPVVVLHAWTTDSRALAALLSWVAVSRLGQDSARGAALGGLAAGAAALCRPELILLGPALVILARRRAWTGLGWGVVTVPWLVIVSLLRGVFTLAPRAWELAPAAWSSWFTVPLVHLLVGPTSFATPLRERVWSAPVESGSFSFPHLEPWVFAEILPLWWVVWVVLGVVAIGRGLDRAAAGLLVIIGIALATLGSVQGRSLPESSLLPVILVSIVLADVGITSLGRWLSSRAPRRLRRELRWAPMLVGLVGIAWGAGPYRRPPAESDPVVAAMREVLAELPPGTPVMTVYASSFLPRELGLVPVLPGGVARWWVLFDTDQPQQALGLVSGEWEPVRVVSAGGRHAALLQLNCDTQTTRPSAPGCR